MWGKGRLLFLYMFFCGVEQFYKVDEEVFAFMGPEGLVWETPFQGSGTFFMPSTQHWGLGENKNLFLRRDTPSTQKVQERPECSEAIRIEAEARGVSTTWKDFFHKNLSVEK